MGERFWLIDHLLPYGKENDGLSCFYILNAKGDEGGKSCDRHVACGEKAFVGDLILLKRSLVKDKEVLLVYQHVQLDIQVVIKLEMKLLIIFLELFASSRNGF